MSIKKTVISGAAIVAVGTVAAPGKVTAAPSPEGPSVLRMSDTGLRSSAVELDKDVRALGAHNVGVVDGDGIRLAQTWFGGSGGGDVKAPIKDGKKLKDGRKLEGGKTIKNGGLKKQTKK